MTGIKGVWIRDVMELNEENFDREVIRSKIPVFVFFWASWCTACKRTQEMVKKLDGEYSEKMKIHSLNVDRNFTISERYNIRGVPTFIVFVDGSETKREIGAKSKKQLEKMISEFV